MTDAASTVPTTRLEELVRWMLLSRRLEERLRALFRRGLVAGGVYLGIGQEAFSAAAGMAMRPGDVFAPSIRDMAGRLAFGETPEEALLVYLGKRAGIMRGRDGNIHRGDIAKGMMPMISHLGAMVSTVAGVLMARRLRGELDGDDLPVGCACLGDGAMGTGAAHEGLNLIAVERLPMVVLLANNQLAYSTPNDRSFACDDLILRAPAYGLTGRSCNGEDPAECLRVVGEAFAAARRGEGPQLVQAHLLRGSGHGEHDDATYVPEHMKAGSRDCLDVGLEQASAAGLGDLNERYGDDIQGIIDAAVATAEASPEPDPSREDWWAYSERWLDQGLRP